MKARSIPATKSQLGSVVQPDGTTTGNEAVELFDAINPHDVGSVDSDEFVGRQFPLEQTEGRAHEMGLVSNLQHNVIVASSNPINIINLEQKDLSRGFDRQIAGRR